MLAGIYRAIWAKGVRNPWTVIHTPTAAGDLVFFDVGAGAKEEVNVGVAGKVMCTRTHMNTLTYTMDAHTPLCRWRPCVF